MKPSVYDDVLAAREVVRKAEARARNAVYALAHEYRKQKNLVSTVSWDRRTVNRYSIAHGRVIIGYLPYQGKGQAKFPKEMLDFAEMGGDVLEKAVACFIQAETEDIERRRKIKEEKAEAAQAKREAETREAELAQLAFLQAKYGVL